MVNNKMELQYQNTQPVFDWNEIGEGNFAPFGKPNMWFRYKRLAFLPTSEVTKMMRKHSNQVVNKSSSTIGELVSDLESTFHEHFSLITEWNINLNGESLPSPKDEPNVWQRMPNFMVQYIVQVMRNDPTNINLADDKSDFLNSQSMDTGI